MMYQKIFIVLSLFITVIGCEQKIPSYGSTTLAEEYIPVCFREVPPSADPVCSEGYVLDIDYQNDVDYCCEGGTSLPGGEGGGNFSPQKICLPVGASFCPPNYAFTSGVAGPDCILTGCVAAGYDTHPVTGECSCACLETFTTGEQQTTAPQCPTVPGLIHIGYQIDNVAGNADTCSYRDADPTVTDITNISPECAEGTLLIQEDQDACLLQTICPEGTILKPDGTCGTCSFPCESANHPVRNGGPVHILFVLDKSGSMTDPFNSSLSRWQAATQSIQDILTAGGPFEYGLELYSYGPADCDVSGIVVPIGPQTTGPIIETMNTSAPGGNTPLVEALALAYSTGFSGIPDSARKAVIVVGDGGDSCSGRPDFAVTLAQEAYTQSDIQTFTLSLTSSVNANNFLASIAEAGGTDTVILPSTIQQIAIDIQGALDATSCGFLLTETQAVNTTDIEVVIDGQVVPESQWHLLGNSVVLEDPWCTIATNGTAQSVTISANCSE